MFDLVYVVQRALESPTKNNNDGIVGFVPVFTDKEKAEEYNKKNRGFGVKAFAVTIENKVVPK